MASLRLAIAASLKEAQNPSAPPKTASEDAEKPQSKAATQEQAKAAPAASPAPQQKKRGKEASTPVAPPPKRSKPKAATKDAPKPAAPRKRSPPAAAPAPRKRDKKLAVAVGDNVDALWPADGEYYPAKVRAVNADGTIALDYADGDRRNDATTSELRCKRQATPAEADPDFAPAAPSTADAPAARSTITDKKALEERMAADGWTKEEKARESSSHVDKYWIDPKDGKKCRSIVEVARKAYPDFLAEATANAPKRPKKEAETGPLACRKG